MGCGASMNGRGEQQTGATSKTKVPVYPAKLTPKKDGDDKKPSSSTNRSHAASTFTETHVAPMQNLPTLGGGEPPSDAIKCGTSSPNNTSAAAVAATARNRISGRSNESNSQQDGQKYEQMRPVTISHSALNAVRPTTTTSSSRSGGSPSHSASSPHNSNGSGSNQRAAAEAAKREKAEAQQAAEEAQMRLSEQSLVRTSSLLDLMVSVTTPSHATRRAGDGAEKDTQRVTPTPRLSNSSSVQSRPAQPVAKGPPMLQQRQQQRLAANAASSPTSTSATVGITTNTNTITTVAATATAKAGSPRANENNQHHHHAHTQSSSINAMEIPGMEVEYLGDGSNFDLDSDDEDDSNSDGVEDLQVLLSATKPERVVDGATSAKNPASSRPPPPTTRGSSGTAAFTFTGGDGGIKTIAASPPPPPPPPSAPGAGALIIQQAANSGSLVSMVETPDGMFTPTSPRSPSHDRLDSVSPVFNGLASTTGSRPTSSYMPGAVRGGRVDQANNNGLATFFNQPRECANCKSPAVAFACEICDDFFLCEDCRFNVELVRQIHDPTHAMLSIQDNHCSSSRTFGGDSIFSLSGEGGVSSLFNPPCSRCGRAIDDTEPLYRCEQCDYVLCLECFFKPAEPVEVDQDSPHEHVLKRFQRKSKSGSVHEGAVVNKTRNSGGNRVINDYVVVRLLGQGSYAKVKLVQHIRTQELYALKILKKQKKNATAGANLGRSRVKLANAGVSEDDLLREIAVMRFIDHPNIVKLKEVIEDVEAQKVYVIMEYCENGPVHALNDPPLQLPMVRQYGADILRGLLHLHSEFLYHRDIKPANCLVNHEGVVKIADFGTCNSQIRTKSSDGTLVFSCPEQVRGEEVSGEVVDSWAFALTLYEMAYGTLPVSTTSIVQHRNAVLGPDPIPVPDAGDAQLRDLLTSMLNKNLKSRMLLSAAVRHPFFEVLHIDPHGAPHSPTQLLPAKQQPSQQAQQQQQQSQQQQQQHAAHPDPRQPRPLAELYDKALESVYRGKNLKDCFHGVRALRRIRRKEIETARHSGVDGGLAEESLGGNEHDYLFEDDEDNSALNSRDTDLDSAPRSPTGYGYGTGSNDGSGNDDDDGGGGVQRHTSGLSVSSKEEEEAVAAAGALDELIQHHFSSKDSKIEVSYVNLSKPATLEKLNQLHATVAEFRLNHNFLTSTAGLRFPTFTMLKEISIAFNRLDAFPEAVLEAPRLVRLDLSHNRIATIPASLATRAPFLERLNLHHNFIAYVGTVGCPTVTPSTSAEAAARFAAKPTTTTTTTTTTNTAASTSCARPTRASDLSAMSVLAAPCLRHVRLSGNPLETLPAALETTNRLELVLDAIPELMEQWKEYTHAGPSTATASASLSKASTQGAKSKLPAVIVWDDSFPVRIPDVEPAVWLAVNNMAVYRVQTLRTCRTRRVVLCQCADPRFPNGAFDSADLEDYFNALTTALQQRRQQRENELNGALDAPGLIKEAASGALPPIVGRAARSYVESYFFVTDDETEQDGGYHSLVEYLNDALIAKEPVLVVVVTSGTTSAVRTNIVAALSTCLTQLRGKDADDISEQAELVVSTMRSLYA